MTLRTLLDERKISMYHLSQMSGIPKTTVIDICSGKSTIENCTARTVFQISKALNCSMEELMQLDDSEAIQKVTDKMRPARESAR